MAKPFKMTKHKRNKNLTQCDICNLLIIGCECQYERHIQPKYRTCWMNIYNDNYPQARLNDDCFEIHVCSAECNEYYELLQNVKLIKDGWKLTELDDDTTLSESKESYESEYKESKVD